MGQGVLAIDGNRGGGGVSGEGDRVLNPFALFPRMFVIESHPCVYAFYAGATIVAFRIWSRDRAAG